MYLTRFVSTLLLMVGLTVPHLVLAAGIGCTLFGFLVRPLGFCGHAEQSDRATRVAVLGEQEAQVINAVTEAPATTQAEEVTLPAGAYEPVPVPTPAPVAENAGPSPLPSQIIIREQGLTLSEVDRRITERLRVLLSVLAARTTPPTSSRTAPLELEQVLAIARANNDNTRGYVGREITEVNRSILSITNAGTLSDATLSGDTTLSALAPNALVYTNGTRTLATDALLSVEDGKLGLGTTTPVEVLTVGGAVYLGSHVPSATANRLYNVNGDLYWNGSIVMASSTGTWSVTGSDVFRLSGNVGIGTSTPGRTLTIGGDQYLTGRFYDSLNSAGTSGGLLTSTGSATRWQATTSANAYYGTDRYGVTGYVPLPYDYLATGSNPRALFTKQLRFDSRNFSINNPALVLREEDDTSTATTKGALIEWQQYLGAGTYPYGIATNSYGSNFTIGSAGHKRVAWLLSHYDSTQGTGEDVHQHISLETVQADFSNIITRFQVSWGEDIALVGFPNSYVRIYDNKPLQFGSDADGSIMYSTTTNELQVTGSNSNSGRVLFRTTSAATKGKFQFGNVAVLEENTGRLGIGTLTPGARINASSSADEVLLKLQNLDGGLTNAPLMQFETDHVNDKIFQAGLGSDSIKRMNITTTGLFEWGAGGSFARDTNLYRAATNTLATDDTLTVALGLGVATTSPFRTFAVQGTVGFVGLTSAAGTPSALCQSENGEVVVNTGAQTCTVSSARFKQDIRSFGDRDAFDLAQRLQPIVFSYRDQHEERIGLLAEDVAAVDPRLMYREAGGEPRGVRYEDITAVLLGAFKHQQAQITGLTRAAGAAVGSTVRAVFERIEAVYARVTNLEAETVQVTGTASVEGKLCVEGVCITGAELRALMEQAGLVTRPVESPAVGEDSTAPFLEETGDPIVSLEEVAVETGVSGDGDDDAPQPADTEGTDLPI